MQYTTDSSEDRHTESFPLRSTASSISVNEETADAEQVVGCLWLSFTYPGYIGDFSAEEGPISLHFALICLGLKPTADKKAIEWIMLPHGWDKVSTRNRVVN